MGRSKAIPRENAIHLAKMLRPIVDRFPSQTAAADAMRISQSHLSQILLAEGRGAGVSVLIRIRAYTGISLDDLLGLPALRPPVAVSDDLEARIVARVMAELSSPVSPGTEPPAREETRPQSAHPRRKP